MVNLESMEIPDVGAGAPETLVIPETAETKLLSETEEFKSFRTPHRINVKFSNITYTVRKHMFTFETKEVLHGVDGEFKAGELTAIMGPSGAGKSCLMNILASYITGAGVTGDIAVNDKPRDISSFRRHSAYIMQDDHIHPDLTVIESMFIAAQLKLSGTMEYKIEKVQYVMKLMNLEEVGTNFTQRLSGGQRKRLVMAFELLGDSSIMFFDEPTSHLDSVTSRQCVEIMKGLAEGGRNVICTIHQPSAKIFNMFDHLYVVAQGFCVYDGRIQNLLPYLESNGFHCPTYHNPSDYMIDVASGEFGDYTEKLSEAAKKDYDKNLAFTGENAKLKVKEPLEIDDLEIVEPFVGFFTQFSVLTYSNLVRISRNRNLPFNIIMSHFIMSIFIGLLYLDIGKDANRMMDNAKLQFFNLLFISFCALSSSLQAFPEEVPVLTREAFNSWYGISALYIAKKVSYMIISTTCSIFYVIIVYFMTNQYFTLGRFFLVLLQYFLVALISLTLGLAHAAGLPPTISTFLGCNSLFPQVIFSGLYVRWRDALKGLRLLFNFSIFKNSFENIMLAIYGYDRGRLDCDDICDNTSPYLILREYDMLEADYWMNSLFLAGFYMFLNFNCILIVMWRLKR